MSQGILDLPLQVTSLGRVLLGRHPPQGLLEVEVSLSPPYSLVFLNRVPIFGASKGHDPSRYPGSGSSSGPNSFSINTHQPESRLCKLPGCRKPAIFDPSINEQREFCVDHIKYVLHSLVRAPTLTVMTLSHVIPDGFAGRCAMCKKMPARLDSEFCSEACRSMSEHMGMPSTMTGNNGHYQQPSPTPRQTAPVAPHMQRVPSNGGSGAAAGVPHANKRPAENSVPEGLVPTCQECRRPIMKESRTGSRFCGRNCEEAYRIYNSSSSSSKSRR